LSPDATAETIALFRALEVALGAAIGGVVHEERVLLALMAATEQSFSNICRGAVFEQTATPITDCSKSKEYHD
jgi:hypothetical protein